MYVYGGRELLSIKRSQVKKKENTTAVENSLFIFFLTPQQNISCLGSKKTSNKHGALANTPPETEHVYFGFDYGR
jgi:hypothetical protein